jgi:hypothetical protein
MGCDCQPEGPLVEIKPAENGFVITAYNKVDRNVDTISLFSKVAEGIQTGDPMAAIQKAMGSERLKESVRRKEVEHHVAKTADEALKILGEILGTMKP